MTPSPLIVDGGRLYVRLSVCLSLSREWKGHSKLKIGKTVVRDTGEP